MTEHIQPTTRPQTKEVTRPNWSAVFSVAFCVASLITVEFLPVSLLTPMAQDLGISEGVAGQSVTVTAFVAMFASLFITQVIGTIDRRKVVILFSVLLTLSCLWSRVRKALPCCCWGAPVWGWGSAASGRCRPRSPCAWCPRGRCRKRFPLSSVRSLSHW